ncbi:Fis family transcriptional regulator [Sulfuricurvum sp.]|uniref:Fis family transcriptional regulator n=1 Tax=Sulfuricurvum sp. TaxID=2025608 RepID=UPI002E33482F|nr:Fis family transcriptional regulator [Sulfuricurvum sp.]HEX5330046.1 Fis family transcriptional regulator [Sulfuricurvum sp.]
MVQLLMDKKQSTMKPQGIGTSFDDFLEAEGMLAEAEAVAIKRVIAYQLEETMKKEHITKTEMAKRMKTSRSAIDRLLDPLNTSITLATIESAVSAMGKRLQIQMV